MDTKWWLDQVGTNLYVDTSTLIKVSEYRNKNEDKPIEKGNMEVSVQCLLILDGYLFDQQFAVYKNSSKL